MRRNAVLLVAVSAALVLLAGARVMVPAGPSDQAEDSQYGPGADGADDGDGESGRPWQTHGSAGGMGLLDRGGPWRMSAPPLIPVEGVYSDLLEDNFGIPRAGDRRHRGIDIPAPLGTPILAVSDGWVVSIREGGAGGRALFLLDRSGQYLFYYAHLDRYADLLWTGRPVRRGEPLGFVGTTGNARGRTPHLHFEVARVDDPARWWSFERVNPYDFLVAGDRIAGSTSR